eukprot:TRINITY_DN8821_c0_g1_i1.p1 TRINITY_DN8821_c0_g1~~TRINITY_DN8821_c0_g1_i1.p1  ORF type:complete len:4205 (-),score=604.71 TRINITY_DN8821_c0_g1_i1:28-12642(-)
MPSTCEGYLYKQASQGLKRFQKRWFRLDGKFLSYSQAPDTPTLGQLDLTCSKVEEDLTHRHCLCIVGPQLPRAYIIQASTAEEQLKWLIALQAAVDSLTQQQVQSKFIVSFQDTARDEGTDSDSVQVQAVLLPQFGPPKATVWHSPAFVSLFCDLSAPDLNVFAADELSSRRGVEELRALSKFIPVATRALQLVLQTPGLDVDPAIATGISTTVRALNDCEAMCTQLCAAVKNEQLLRDFLIVVAQRVRQLPPGGTLIIPGGWMREEERGRAVLFVVHNRGDERLSFAICNTGEGTQYHAMAASAEPPGISVLTHSTFVLEDVPRQRLTDGSFWFLALRLVAYPAKDHGPQQLYGTLLPYLNSRPLMANVNADTTEFRAPPRLGDDWYGWCTLEVMRHILRLGATPSPSIDHAELLFRFGILQIAETEMVGLERISRSEGLLLDLACKHTAAVAASQDPPASVGILKTLRATLERIQGRAQALQGLNNSVQQPPKWDVAATGAAAFPLFGRLRRDMSVEALAGDARVPPILVPVALTKVQNRVRTFPEATNALRHCLHVCTLLANQRGLIRDTYALRATLIQQLFTEALPLPLPYNHKHATTCFWASQAIRYEVQIDIVRLLDELLRHFLCAAFSLRLTRAFDASRILTVACMAAILDAVLRMRAVDIPSHFSLHYAGTAKGPVRPFGFELGQFAVESEHLRFANPALAAARAQVLDYFARQKDLVAEDHVVFRFRNMGLGAGEAELIDQLCLQMAFSRDPGTVPLYISGELPELGLLYPELPVLRNIVFALRALMAPTSDCLPAVQDWAPTDALLRWSFKDEAFVVSGFGTSLRCTDVLPDGTVVAQQQTGLLQRIGSTIGGGKKRLPRAPLSASDPSHLASQPIETEDDVLHIEHLPDFNGHLKPRDCELLLQYLTVPYLRIPLILEFFADPLRVNALRSVELQDVLESCLFDPGLWQEALEKQCPDFIPAPNRDHLATPVGLLFNELQKSPKGILASLDSLLTIVLEKDTGRFTSAACKLILYVVRIFIQVDGFVAFLVRHAEWLAQNPERSESRWRAHVRGLAIDQSTPSGVEHLAHLRETQKRWRQRLMGEVYSMFEYWAERALRTRSDQQAAVLLAHMAYLYRHVPGEELDRRGVETLLIAQCFVNVHYRFDLDARGVAATKRKGDTAQLSVDRALGIAQTDLFELFQAHRVNVLNFLEANPQERGSILEAVVRVVTFTGTLTASKPALAPGGSSPITKPRAWITMDKEENIGRYAPENELAGIHDESGGADGKAEGGDAHQSSHDRSKYEGWLRHVTTQRVDTEVNLQLGEFTLKRHPLQTLDDWANLFADFVHVFGEVTPAHPVQCAEVKHTTKREWWRLVGRRHDLQRWLPDDRAPMIPSNYRKYPKGLKSGEEWVARHLDPVMSVHFPNLQLSLQPQSCDGASHAVLLGIIPAKPEPAKKDKLFAKQQPQRPLAVKEVVVFRARPVVHVYDIVECGRRFQRSLSFTSDLQWCLSAPQPSALVVNTPHLLYGTGPAATLTGGKPNEPIPPAESLTIVRQLTKLHGEQTYVSSKWLAGLVPQALFADYEFWQNPDGDLVGYPHPHRRESGKTPALIKIEVLKLEPPNREGTAEALAIVRRHALKGEAARGAPAAVDDPKGHALFTDDNLDPQAPVLTLLNLQYASRTDPWYEIATAFLKLDHLSHILVWTRTKVSTAADACSIDCVELPRLHLSFSARKDPTGCVRLFSEDHAGLFVSDQHDPRVVALCQGIGNALLLENAEGELFVLVSAAAIPTRLEVRPNGNLSSNGPLAAAALFPTELVVDHSPEEWVQNLGESRHYLFPVHPSRAFLSATTLSAQLYLLLLRFYARRYGDVFSMAPSCVSDGHMSAEERQLWDQLEYVNGDLNADAHSCRLKLTLATTACREKMPLPWNIANEYRLYITKRKFVSAASRLTLQEEETLLAMIPVSSRPWELMNRAVLLGALGGAATKEQQPRLQVLYPPTRRPPLYNFDSVIDNTCLEGQAGILTSFFSMVNCALPPENELFGGNAVKFLNKCLENGLKLRGGGDDCVGFLFIYLLMCEHAALRLLPEDHGHNWGSLLLRMLPAKETQEKGHLISLLRVLAANPHACTNMPRFEDDRRVKSSVVLPGQDIMKRLLDGITAHLQQLKGQISWSAQPAEFCAPTTVAVPIQRYYDHLLCRVPVCGDYDCERRELAPFAALPIKDSTVSLANTETAAFAAAPLAPVGLAELIGHFSRTERNLSIVNAELPFNVEKHICAQSHAATSMLQRLRTDVRWFSEKENSAKAIRFKSFGLEHGQQPTTAQLQAFLQQLGKLSTSLQSLYDGDAAHAADYLDTISHIANTSHSSKEQDGLVFDLARTSGLQTTVGPELFLQLFLSSDGMPQLRRLNPSLTEEHTTALCHALSAFVFTVNRMGQATRSLALVREVAAILRELLPGQSPTAAIQGLAAMANRLAENLTAARHYIEPAKGGTFIFDPRFAVFEFVHNVLLRESQVALVRKLVGSIREGKAVCHQMIMGAGKTTVVAPLLALLLGNGGRLVLQVVPHSLLEFSRAVLREKFASVVRKPIYTFDFDRFTPASPALLQQLIKARDTRAVVCANPTSIKSLYLRFVEICHTLDELRGGGRKKGAVGTGLFSKLRGAGPHVEDAGLPDRASLLKEAEICSGVISVFQSGALILDEVDLLLHPLRSELHWPLGVKEPLDFTKPIAGGDHGLRWQIPFHLLDAVLHCLGNVGPAVTRQQDSRDAVQLLATIKGAVERGCKQKVIQTTPHFVLLSPQFYERQLKPLLAKWAVPWLRAKQLTGINDEQTVAYLLHQTPDDLSPEVQQLVGTAVSDLHVQMLNLTRDWLHTLLPHVLSKVDRVGYGLLTPEWLEKHLRIDPRMPRSRQLLAVPFVGKDVPSHASEFSHPEVLVGLTILAYRYEGLRMKDFQTVIGNLQELMQQEFGPYRKRKACKLFAKWVRLAGGRIRGMGPRKEPAAGDTFGDNPLDDLWPLELVDTRDVEQMDVLYQLLRHRPHVIEWHLHEFVFPLTMNHAGWQLSASGQELGGDLLFPLRVGFSGTPSDLLPTELSPCHYQQGDDAQMLHVLTRTDVVHADFAEDQWTVLGLLKHVATASSPPFHALIDTGALITGLTNLEVARLLLENGLVGMQGVVFLDAEDRQMVLLRDGLQVVPASQCGLSAQKRFTFYDQVHTTGMDIKQAPSAVAALTLGKDMTFRDYSQGAYRMRGIGIGQRIAVIVIPEVARLIRTQVALGLDIPIDERAAATAQLPQDQQSRQLLQDVCAWLVINSMRSEKIQFNLLCQQNLTNLWRKKAYSTLLQQGQLLSREGTGAGAVGTSLDLLRERIDYTVANSLPDPVPYSEKMKILAQRHSTFPLQPEEQAIQARILDTLEKADKVTQEMERNASQNGATALDKYPLDVATQLALSAEQVQEQEQEQEKEQEKEQEQEQEVEEEVEAEVVPEIFAKLRYSREDDKVAPWPLTELQQAPKTSNAPGGNPAFQPCSEFGIPKHLTEKPPRLRFPPFTYLTRNHFNCAWSWKLHRRPKNVIVVLEYSPETTGLRYEEAAWHKPAPLTGLEEKLLQSTAALFDQKALTTGIPAAQVPDMLRALDIDAPQEVLQNVSAAVLSGKDHLTYEMFQRVVLTLAYFRLQTGRYFVALSLAEAETLRGILHLRQGSPLITGVKAVAALRSVRSGNLILDASDGFHSPEVTPILGYQRELAEQFYRFMDGEVYFTSKQLFLLLRAFHGTDCDSRALWYKNVRRVRRRPQMVVERMPVAGLFSTPSPFPTLRQRATIVIVRSALIQRGMWPRDAFLAWDTNSDAVLSPTELFRGLEGLGMKLTAAQVKDLIQIIDPEQQGITLLKWKRLFDGEDAGDEEETDEQKSWPEMASASVAPSTATDTETEVPTGAPQLPTNVQQKPVPKLALGSLSPTGSPVQSTDAEDPDSGEEWDMVAEEAALTKPGETDGLPMMTPRVKPAEKALNHAEVQLVPHRSFAEVWTTHGTMSRTKASLWIPTLAPRKFHRNRVRICLGHYASAGFDSPDKNGRPLLLEFIDHSASGLSRDNACQGLLSYLCPHPYRFRQVWQKPQGKTPLFVWEPIPPNPQYVALGMVCTTSEDPPPRNSVRCVPRQWTQTSTFTPTLVWDDQGMGGRPGSVWIVNSLNLMAVLPGVDPPPPGKFLDLNPSLSLQLSL